MQGPVDWIARLLDRQDTPISKTHKVLCTSISRNLLIRAHTPGLKRMILLRPSNFVVGQLNADTALPRREFQRLGSLTRDIQAALANPHPEASLRRQLEGWEKRQPDYKDLGPGLEEIAFQQRARLQAMITRSGALKSLTFVRVAKDGSDIYDARFAHGGLQWRVSPLSSSEIHSSTSRAEPAEAVAASPRCSIADCHRRAPILIGALARPILAVREPNLDPMQFIWVE